MLSDWKVKVTENWIEENSIDLEGTHKTLPIQINIDDCGEQFTAYGSFLLDDELYLEFQFEPTYFPKSIRDNPEKKLKYGLTYLEKELKKKLNRISKRMFRMRKYFKLE